MIADAVVIGAGPNGLVAANVLADAGWSVVVLEANDQPGGAVRTEELTAPGFRNDVFSAFYPMTAASPVMRDLRLHEYGLQWTHAPAVLAHVREDRPAAVLYRDLERTVTELEAGERGDGERYRAVAERWERVSEPLMASLLRPFPPVRSAARLIARTRVAGTLDLARLALLPLRRFVEEEFRGESAADLFAGNALHADLTPDSSGSALFGWMLVGLAQQVGFPVPVGGAERITDALVTRGRARGVQIVCSARVSRIGLESGRATAAITAAGDTVRARRAILADCDARRLFLDLVGEEALPPRLVGRLGRVQRSSSTFKVDWALSGPVPWRDERARGAGTVHVAEGIDELTTTAAQLATGTVPDRPFLLVGQMTTSDPTRSPAGTESMWAYTHVPQDIRRDAGGDGITGVWSGDDVERFTARIEARIETHAPGFRDLIVGRHVMSPVDLEARNANLVGGDISGGTAQLHQQLILRPVPGSGRPETGIPGLFLASASAHPGGAVHGACGANAARAAVLHHRVGRLRRSR